MCVCMGICVPGGKCVGLCLCGAVLANEGRIEKRHSVYSGILVRSGMGPDLSGQSCLGVSPPDYPRHGQLYFLLQCLPSVQLGKTGGLTNGGPYERPATLYQTDHAMFNSLSERAGTFLYSQVKAINSSLCTIYC